jgi:hypothetical protein
MRRKILRTDQLDGRPREGAVADVAFAVRTGDDQENIDALVGKIGGGCGVGELVETALDAALESDIGAYAGS